MQQERVERICRFCKKNVISPQGKRLPVVSVFNTLKNKELLVAPQQESVILAAEIEKLGHFLQRGENFSELSCLSCARQLVRLSHSYALITGRCNEPFEQPENSSVCTTPPSSKRPSALRSPTGETPSAKRQQERALSAVSNNENDVTEKSSRKSLNFAQSMDEENVFAQSVDEENVFAQSVDEENVFAQSVDEENVFAQSVDEDNVLEEIGNPLTVEEKMQARMNLPQGEGIPVVKVTFLNLYFFYFRSMLFEKLNIIRFIDFCVFQFLIRYLLDIQNLAR